MAAFKAGGPDAAPAEDAKPAAATAATAAPATTDADTDDDEATTTAPAVDDDADDEDTTVVADPDDDDADPKDAKGHQAVKRAEVRMRAEVAAERAKMQADLERAVGEIRPKLERLEKLEQSIKAGRFDFDAAAELFGWTDEDMETVGHAAFGRSPKYKDKPEIKAQASRAMREREARAESAAIKARQDKLEADIKQRDEQAAQTVAREKWLTEVRPLVDDKAPLTRRLLAKNPAKAERLLAATALELWEKNGAPPSNKAVVRELEKRRAAHQAEFVDPPAETAPAAAETGKKPPPAAAKKDPPKPTNGANGAPVEFKTRRELLEAFKARPLD